MIRKINLVLVIVLSLIWLGGCNLPGRSPEVQSIGQAQTLAAQTVEARLTQNAGGVNLQTVAPTNTISQLITNTPQPSNTPQASNTPYYAAATSTSVPCNRATFIEDVTIPDGSDMDPGETFTKTWRLKNTGSCTWNSNYKLVFDSGDAMSAAAVVNFPSGTVAPNGQVNLSVEFTAPSAAGDYRSDWKLRSDTGEVFGLGANATGTFYVEINVVAPLSYSLSVANFHDCSGDTVLALAVLNNGSEFLQSSTGTLTNLSNSVTKTFVPNDDPFVEDPNTCSAGFVSDADPGQTYYFLINLSSASSGDQFQITTTFCTENGLGGDCLDKTKTYTVP